MRQPTDLSKEKSLESLESVTSGRDGLEPVRRSEPVEPVEPERLPATSLPFPLPTRADLMRSLMSGATESLNRAGLTVDHIARVLYEASRADRTVTATHQGRITDERSYPDHQTRVEAVMHGARLHGLLVDRREIDVRKQTIIYKSGIDRSPLPD